MSLSPRPRCASTLASARALTRTRAGSGRRVKLLGGQASEPHGPAMQLTQEPPLRRCSPYTRGCASWGRLTAFEVPAALRQLTRLDIEITVRGYGTLSPIGRPQERTEVPRRGATEPSQTHADPGHLSRSRSRSRRRAL